MTYRLYRNEFESNFLRWLCAKFDVLACTTSGMYTIDLGTTNAQLGQQIVDQIGSAGFDHDMRRLERIKSNIIYLCPWL